MIGFIGTTTIGTDRVQVFGEFLITKTLPVRSMHIGPDELKRAKTDSSLQPKPAHPTAIISGKGGVMADNNCTCPDCSLKLKEEKMDKLRKYWVLEFITFEDSHSLNGTNFFGTEDEAVSFYREHYSHCTAFRRHMFTALGCDGKEHRDIGDSITKRLFRSGEYSSIRRCIR